MQIKKLFNFSTPQTILWLISIAFLVQVAISCPLWLTASRTFPLLPLFEMFPLDFGIMGHYISFGLLIISLLFVTLFSNKRWSIGLVLGLLMFFFLQDELRLQAWSYQYFLMFGVLFLPSKLAEKIALLQVIMICTYWWSGIQKINIHFITTVYPWLCETFEVTAFLAKYTSMGYVVAVFEALLGVGLLFSATQKFTAHTAIIFHLIILLILSPLGHNWNTVVIPWNVAMIGFLWVLFIKNESSIHFKSLLKQPSFIALFVLIGILPSLNFFYLWREQLSFTMYSGVTTETVLYYDTNNSSCLPQVAIDQSYDITLQRAITLDDWSMQELKVPVYGTTKITQQLKNKWCDCLGDNSFIALVQYERMDIEESTSHIFSCGEE